METSSSRTRMPWMRRRRRRERIPHLGAGQISRLETRTPAAAPVSFDIVLLSHLEPWNHQPSSAARSVGSRPSPSPHRPDQATRPVAPGLYLSLPESSLSLQQGTLPPPAGLARILPEWTSGGQIRPSPTSPPGSASSGHLERRRSSAPSPLPCFAPRRAGRLHLASCSARNERVRALTVPYNLSCASQGPASAPPACLFHRSGFGPWVSCPPAPALFGPVPNSARMCFFFSSLRICLIIRRAHVLQKSPFCSCIS